MKYEEEFSPALYLNWGFNNKKLDKKLEELSALSDYREVFIIGKKLKLGEIYPSTRKNSKYMIWNPYKDKYTHFGSMKYQDYTLHENKERRDKFRIRNKKWADAEIYSPAFLSYYILW